MNLALSSYSKDNGDRRALQDAEIKGHIERIHGEFPSYGYRRLGRQLRREGIVVNDKRFRRVQRQYQLYPIRWPPAKQSPAQSGCR